MTPLILTWERPPYGDCYLYQPGPNLRIDLAVAVVTPQGARRFKQYRGRLYGDSFFIQTESPPCTRRALERGINARSLELFGADVVGFETRA